MNEPEQNQPITPDKGHEEAGAAPVPSSSTVSAGSVGQSSQPEYGQRTQPEYGAMANQYPMNYDPYVYGAPEPPKTKDEQQPSPVQTNPYMQSEGQQTNPYAVPGRQRIGQNPGSPYQYGPNAYQQPGMYPIDLDDPRQNPLYGHWDSYAILSLVFALLMPIPRRSGGDGRHRHVAHQKTPYERLRARCGRVDHQRAVHHRRGLDGVSWRIHVRLVQPAVAISAWRWCRARRRFQLDFRLRSRPTRPLRPFNDAAMTTIRHSWTA